MQYNCELAYCGNTCFYDFSAPIRACISVDNQTTLKEVQEALLSELRCDYIVGVFEPSEEEYIALKEAIEAMSKEAIGRLGAEHTPFADLEELGDDDCGEGFGAIFSFEFVEGGE